MQIDINEFIIKHECQKFYGTEVYFQCPFCPVKTSTQHDFQRHLNRFTMNSSEHNKLWAQALYSQKFDGANIDGSFVGKQKRSALPVTKQELSPGIVYMRVPVAYWSEYMRVLECVPQNVIQHVKVEWHPSTEKGYCFIPKSVFESCRLELAKWLSKISEVQETF